MMVYVTNRVAKCFALRLMPFVAIFVLGTSVRNAACQASSSLQNQIAAQQSKAAAPAVVDTDGLILKLQERVKKAPKDFSGYDDLGAAYFQRHASLATSITTIWLSRP